ncbi:DUF3995 domain-containing protein [Parasphingorhabdus pacifica]
MHARTIPDWPARAAAVWAFAFAALSVFWALGGQLGLHPFETATPSTTLVVMNVLAATAKVALGLLALASISERVTWSLLGVALWTAALALLTYGAVGMLSNGLVIAGLVDLGGPPTRFHWYFTLIWDPYFLLGGVLFLLTAVRHGKRRD